jgi:AcrR family transcriptional regulator
MAPRKAEPSRPGLDPASARDRVLGAFEALLISDGERASTLDAVAARAGVSKGGLLYHFASKDALIVGLLERLEALVAVDIERMRAAPAGAVDYFIRTSVASAGSPNELERAIVACSCLAQGAHPEVRGVLRRVQAAWLSVLAEVIDDPVVARVVMLVGDGLYFNSATGLSDETPTSASMDDLVAVLTALVSSRVGPDPAKP